MRHTGKKSAAVLGGLLVFSGAVAVPPSVTVEEPVTVQTDPSNPLDVNVGNTVSVGNSVEIKNTEGDPIGVRERPGNGAYVLTALVSEAGGPTTVVVPVSSHMQGVTINVGSSQSGTTQCFVAITYPGSAPVRFDGGYLVSVSLPARGGTIHVPFADYYAFEGTEIEVGLGFDPGCSGFLHFQMRPIPVDIAP